MDNHRRRLNQIISKNKEDYESQSINQINKHSNYRQTKCSTQATQKKYKQINRRHVHKNTLKVDAIRMNNNKRT